MTVPRVSSALKAVDLKQIPAPLIIGERINTQGSRKAKKLVLADDFDGLVDLARIQAEDGAHCLDVCVATTERSDEREFMLTLVKKLSLEIDAPLVIDSTDPDVIESSVKQIPGRPIINSINLEGDGSRFEKLAPIMAKYGLPAIALCIGPNGMAKTPQQKVETAELLYETGKNYGLKIEQFIFDVLTFTLATGEEEFQNVACDCRFDTSTTPLTNAAAYPEWVSGLDSYIDKEGKQVDKTKGCVQGGGSNCSSNPNPLCDVCCKDHHDTNATVDGVAIAPRKYDPYRSSSDYDSSTGDHNHYNLAGTLVSSGQYLEACRLKRVNGYWRVYQDWNLVTLTTLPLSDLIDPTTKAIYASYVNSIIDEHLDESEVSGGTLTTPPTKPSALDHTDSSNYVTLSAVGEHRDLTARAVYLDYIDTTHLTALQAKKSAGSDYLLHLPFYELEVASVSNWNSGNISAVNVGPYNAPGAGIDLTGGELQSLAETSYVSVAANIKLSNSGIVALNSPIDSGDGDIYSDDVGVCVGGTCSAAPAGSCLTPWGLTVADGASVTAYENATVTSLDLCVSDTQTCSSGSLTLAYNNPSCVIAVTSTCNTSVSGSANHKDDLINLSILTGVVTTIESCTVSPSKSYTCPTVTTELSAVISVISSGTVAESTVTPTCSPPNVVNF